MTEAGGASSGRWRRVGRWLNGHPLVISAVFLGLALLWIVGSAIEHQFERLPVAVVYLIVGLVGLGRKSLVVRRGVLTVPNRWWGGRTFGAAEIACFEVPESVWSIEPSYVVLPSGERLVLRGADRFRAKELGDALAVTVLPVKVVAAQSPQER